MPRICLIGNSGVKHQSEDGQTVKVRLYLKKMKDENIDVSFIDLENFSHHPLGIFRKIIKGIKECDRIVLLTAERGCRVLIPFINYFNRKSKKPFVLPLIGTSVLHYSVDRLNDSEKEDFFINKNYGLCKKSKNLIKNLSQITAILPETENLCTIFKEFYSLDNVEILTNFREENAVLDKKYILGSNIKLVFLSRVMREKGIFDLLKVISELKKEGLDFSLDIYGELHLNNEDKTDFFKTVSKNKFNYCGAINNDKVIETLSKYDLFIFPTRFASEGTPGVIVESLISGTPVLTSNFPQASLLLKENFDSIFYNLFDVNDLKYKLVQIYNNRELLESISLNSKKSGERFLYASQRAQFLNLVCGIVDK